MEFKIIEEQCLSFFSTVTDNKYITISGFSPYDKPSNQEGKYTLIILFTNLGVDRYNSFSKCYASWFDPRTPIPFEKFQILLLIFMHLTNNFLCRYAVHDTVIFRCHCYKSNKTDRKKGKDSCKFSITVSNVLVDNNINIVAINFLHNHSIIPTEEYNNKIYSVSIPTLKKIVQTQIEAFVEESRAHELQRSLDAFFNGGLELFKDGKNLPTDLYTNNLRPSSILEALEKNKDRFSSGENLLLKQLVNKKNRKLKKKFDTMVGEIKREMIRKEILMVK